MPRTSNADYLLQRLRRDEPAAAGRVLRGEVSPFRAAVQVGIRSDRFTVYVPADPVAMARALRRRLDGAQVAALIKALGG